MDKKNLNKRTLGTFGEDAACKFLEDKSYIIRERNFRAGKLGELDIIAQHNYTICFIEVKSRKTLNFGTPAESVTYSKMQTIKLLAQIYLKKNHLTDMNLRFDVIEVFLGGTFNNPTIKNINHIENAF